MVVAVVLSIALTIYRGFRWSLKELAMDLDEKEGTAFKAITEEGSFKRAQGALILELGGIVSFVNFESVIKKLNKRVEALYPEDRQVRKLLRCSYQIQTNLGVSLEQKILIVLSELKHLDQTAAKKLIDFTKQTKQGHKYLLSPNGKTDDQ